MYNYFITYPEYMAITNRLKAIAKLDKNVDNRIKYRIRYYNNDPSLIHLEKKSKVNGLCNKQAVVLTKSEVEQILRGEINFLMKKDDPLCVEFYTQTGGGMQRPKVIRTYKREPYIYNPGNVRITFDTEIGSSLSKVDFLEDTTGSWSVDGSKV